MIKILKNLEERGTAPSHRKIEEGPLTTPHIARVPRFDRLRCSTPLAVFEQFEHCYNLQLALLTFFRSCEAGLSDVEG